MIRDIDFQDRLWNLKQSHIERIRAINNTHKSVAYFFDLLRTKEDVLDILKHVDIRSTQVFDTSTAKTSVLRNGMIADFNRYAGASDSMVGPRLLMNLRSATGFRLHKTTAVVILCRTPELGRYETHIGQAMARVLPTDPDDYYDDSDVHMPSAYTIFYGDSNA